MMKAGRAGDYGFTRPTRSLAATATATAAYQRSAFAGWLACVGCWIRGVAVGEPGCVQVSRCSGERSDKVGSREMDSEPTTRNRSWFDLSTCRARPTARWVGEEGVPVNSTDLSPIHLPGRGEDDNASSAAFDNRDQGVTVRDGCKKREVGNFLGGGALRWMDGCYCRPLRYGKQGLRCLPACRKRRASVCGLSMSTPPFGVRGARTCKGNA